jgi:hypothetical protein
MGNALYIVTKEALYQLPRSQQERVTGEIVSFIGTGEFFSIPPIKVTDDALGSAGTQHKWGTIKTKYGVFSVNEIEGRIYLNDGKLKDLTIGNRNYFENVLISNLYTQLYIKFGTQFPFNNNPANPNGVGYISAFDTRHERILLTKRDYKILPEKLAIINIASKIPTVDIGFVYCSEDGKFYQGLTPVLFSDPEYFENKSWTMSYSFYTDGWTAWHSYIPNFYIYNQNNLYLFIDNGTNGIYKANKDHEFQTFFGVYRPFIVEYVSLGNPLINKLLEDLTIQTRAKRWDNTLRGYVDENYITFNKITAYNENQSTGELIMKIKQTQPNPEDWYQQQVVNNLPGVILISRAEKNWNINELRDYVVDYGKPLFTNGWSIISPNYFIDKVITPGVIDYQKPWEELQNLRDKFVIVRLKFDNFNTVRLSLNYTVETEQVSVR